MTTPALRFDRGSVLQPVEDLKSGQRRNMDFPNLGVASVRTIERGAANGLHYGVSARHGLASEATLHGCRPQRSRSLICMLRCPIFVILLRERKLLSVFPETS
jgi:hypothetical protein